jgi:putative hydrolase of the HAD superfamily
LKPARAVLFDVDGVLIHGYHARPELRRCWDEHITRDFGVDRERFKNEFIFGPFVKEVIVGRRDLKAALAEALPPLGFSGDPQDFIDYWLEKDSHVYHDLLDKIRILKDSGRARLYIATNQEHNRARHLMDKIGFGAYFEDIFYSGRLGALKPATEYFQAIAAALGPGDEPPVFFDDTPAVVEGALKYGWEAVEFLDTRDLCRNDFVRDILENA